MTNHFLTEKADRLSVFGQPSRSEVYSGCTLPNRLFLRQREAVGADVGIAAGIIPVGIAFINRILDADNLPLHIIFIIILFVVGHGNVKRLCPRPDNHLIVRNNLIPI